MNDTKYNGWANYETWVVKLWLDNDEGSADMVAETADEILARAKPERHFTREERAAINMAAYLQDMHEDVRPEVPGVFADLLGAALSSVNWDEIARSYIEEAVERESEE